MTKENLGGSSSLVDLMELARSRALLDKWDVEGNAVRLSVGSFEVELRRKAADRFVRGLLRTHEASLNGTGD